MEELGKLCLEFIEVSLAIVLLVWGIGLIVECAEAIYHFFDER